jgi:hypothetical protein
MVKIKMVGIQQGNQKFQPKYRCKYSKEATTTIRGKISMN